jgi:hypothetical protein
MKLLFCILYSFRWISYSRLLLYAELIEPTRVRASERAGRKMVHGGFSWLHKGSQRCICCRRAVIGCASRHIHRSLAGMVG